MNLNQLQEAFIENYIKESTGKFDANEFYDLMAKLNGEKTFNIKNDNTDYKFAEDFKVLEDDAEINYKLSDNDKAETLVAIYSNLSKEMQEKYLKEMMNKRSVLPYKATTFFEKENERIKNEGKTNEDNQNKKQNERKGPIASATRRTTELGERFAKRREDKKRAKDLDLTKEGKEIAKYKEETAQLEARLQELKAEFDNQQQQVVVEDVEDLRLEDFLQDFDSRFKELDDKHKNLEAQRELNENVIRRLRTKKETQGSFRAEYEPTVEAIHLMNEQKLDPEIVMAMDSVSKNAEEILSSIETNNTIPMDKVDAIGKELEKIIPEASLAAYEAEINNLKDKVAKEVKDLETELPRLEDEYSEKYTQLMELERKERDIKENLAPTKNLENDEVKQIEAQKQPLLDELKTLRETMDQYKTAYSNDIDELKNKQDRLKIRKELGQKYSVLQNIAVSTNMDLNRAHLATQDLVRLSNNYRKTVTTRNRATDIKSRHTNVSSYGNPKEALLNDADVSLAILKYAKEAGLYQELAENEIDTYSTSNIIEEADRLVEELQKDPEKLERFIRIIKSKVVNNVDNNTNTIESEIDEIKGLKNSLANERKQYEGNKEQLANVINRINGLKNSEITEELVNSIRNDVNALNVNDDVKERLNEHIDKIIASKKEMSVNPELEAEIEALKEEIAKRHGVIDQYDDALKDIITLDNELNSGLRKRSKECKAMKQAISDKIANLPKPLKEELEDYLNLVMIKRRGLKVMFKKALRWGKEHPLYAISIGLTLATLAGGFLSPTFHMMLNSGLYAGGKALGFSGNFLDSIHKANLGISHFAQGGQYQFVDKLGSVSDGLYTLNGVEGAKALYTAGASELLSALTALGIGGTAIGGIIQGRIKNRKNKNKTDDETKNNTKENTEEPEKAKTDDKSKENEKNENNVVTKEEFEQLKQQVVKLSEEKQQLQAIIGIMQQQTGMTVEEAINLAQQQEERVPAHSR